MNRLDWAAMAAIAGLLLLAPTAEAQMSLTTSFASNNACDANFFNVEATGGADAIVDMLDINTTASGMVEVWVRPGTHVGFESSMVGWTMVTQVPVVSAGTMMPTPVPITTPFVIPASTVVGVYVTTAGPGGGSQLNYINGSGGAGGVGTFPQASDAFLTIYEGAGECAYFGGGPNRPRNFSGTIYYNVGCQGSCLNPFQVNPTVMGLPGFRTSDDTIMVDTTICMMDQNAPSCQPLDGDDAFVRFTAPFEGTATIDTCGLGTTFDTILVGLDGAGGCGALAEIACNDDDPGGCGATMLESLISFPILPGITYYASVDGFNGASGTAEVRVQLTEVPTSFVPCPGLAPNSISAAAPRPMAIEMLQLPTTSMGGSQVAWLPCRDQYYAFEVGSPTGLYEVFDNAGVQIGSSSMLGLNGRAIGYEPNTGTIQLITANAQTGGGPADGLFEIGLDPSAIYDGTSMQLAAAIPGLAGNDSAPVFDYQRNLLYSREGSDTVNVIDPLTGMSTGTIVLDSVAAGSPTFIPGGLAFTGIFGLELIVGTADSAVVFNLTGGYVATIPLGSTVAPGNYSGSFVNDLYWVWDGLTMQWRGFDLFDTQFSLPCSSAMTGTDLVLAAGAHTIDTDTGDIDGVPSPAFDGVAFNFDNVDIQVGATVAVSGSQGLVISALGDITVDGDINAAGQDGLPGLGCNNMGGPGGPGGPGGGDGGQGGGNQQTDGDPGMGPGGGFPGVIDSSGGGGGGFAMAGLPGGGANGGAGGSPYIFILPVVFGGSGAGGASADDDPPAGVDPGDDGGGGGGGGGGAVVLNAGGVLSVGGTIDASGGDGGNTGCAGNTGTGGGGSGGYVALLSASGMPSITGMIDVSAGLGFAAGTLSGGDGSDGRMFVDVTPCGFTCAITGPAAPPSSSLVTVQVDALTMAGFYDATFDFSLDGGSTWALCSPARDVGGMPIVPNPALGLIPGMMSPFRWDSAQDGIPYPSNGVLVRATVTDGVGMSSCTTAPFDIGCQCGDCNLAGDGITILDALVAAQIGVGLVIPMPEQNLCCDVEASGMITVIDALQMAQAAAALPFTPMCP